MVALGRLGVEKARLHLFFSYSPFFLNLFNGGIVSLDLRPVEGDDFLVASGARNHVPQIESDWLLLLDLVTKQELFGHHDGMG